MPIGICPDTVLRNSTVIICGYELYSTSLLPSTLYSIHFILYLTGLINYHSLILQFLPLNSYLYVHWILYFKK